jgi:hypothetical protein
MTVSIVALVISLYKTYSKKVKVFGMKTPREYAKNVITSTREAAFVKYVLLPIARTPMMTLWHVMNAICGYILNVQALLRTSSPLWRNMCVHFAKRRKILFKQKLKSDLMIDEITC